jgi:hypothetical protein
LYADPDPAFLDECGSGSSADPDSGKIWTKFSEDTGTLKEFCFHQIFLTLNNLYQVLCLKYDCIENTNFYNFFWSSGLIFCSFSGLIFPLLDPDPGAHRMRIQCGSGFGSETLDMGKGDAGGETNAWVKLYKGHTKFL